MTGALALSWPFFHGWLIVLGSKPMVPLQWFFPLSNPFFIYLKQPSQNILIYIFGLKSIPNLLLSNREQSYFSWYSRPTESTLRLLSLSFATFQSKTGRGIISQDVAGLAHPDFPPEKLVFSYFGSKFCSSLKLYFMLHFL